MRIKSGSMVGLVMLSVVPSQAVRAEDTKVLSAAESTKVGLQFRAEVNRDDHGLDKVQGYTPSAGTTVGVQDLLLLIGGNLNKDTEYHFRFNLWDPYPTKGGPLDYGYGTHWFNDMLGFSIGKLRIMQGGWDTYDNGFRDHWTGAYADNLAFNDYDNAVSFHIKAAGQINIQLLNDKVVPATPSSGINAEWNKKSNPTVALGWVGDLGIIKPLLDYGTFDNQKSSYFDVGLKTEVAGVTARFDYRDESYSHRVGDPGMKPHSKIDHGTSYTVLASYDIAHAATPWAYFSTYDKKEGKGDVKTNSYAVDATGKRTPLWNDNKMVWGVGADVAGPLGKGWTPYLAYVSTSGKFLDPVGNNKVTRTDGQVRLGVLGEF